MSTEIERGESLLADGHEAEAERCFRGLLDRDPRNTEALNNLGVIAYRKNELKEAAAYFERALAIDPLYRDSVENLKLVTRLTRQAETAAGEAPRLAGARISIVAPFDNKFNELYRRYFSRDNEVRLLRPRSQADLESPMDWSDITFTTWCNEPLVYLSRQPKKSLLVTHIHSYEILTPPLIQNVRWPNVDGVVFVADHIRELANQMWSRQLRDVPQTTVLNGVEPGEYPFHEHAPGPNIGYVGYLNHKKGIGLLLQCISAAVANDPSVKLHVAGSFQEPRFEVYMKHLMAEMGLTDNIVFHGWVKDIPGFLAGMNYVISTSPWEGCPYNVIEAMACGVKPLIHNWRGARDLFPNELVFNTLEEFVSLLSEGYDSAAYRQIVESTFNCNRNLRGIESFLAERLAESGRRINTSVATAPSTDTEAAPAGSLVCAQQPREPIQPPAAIDFHQRLDGTVGLIENRKQFTVDFCIGKKVLHVGCVDSGIMDQRIREGTFLLAQIDKVARSQIGIDIEESGIARLKEAGFDVRRVDIEKDVEQLRALSREVDVIVIPEVIEHLSNVGAALDNLKASGFRGDILISTPNAFSWRALNHLGNHVELVHPDHVCYYSPSTLSTLLSRHGFVLDRLFMYYWPSDDEIGRQFADLLQQCPHLAEGLIAIVRNLDH